MVVVLVELNNEFDWLLLLLPNRDPPEPNVSFGNSLVPFVAAVVVVAGLEKFNLNGSGCRFPVAVAPLGVLLLLGGVAIDCKLDDVGRLKNGVELVAVDLPKPELLFVLKFKLMLLGRVSSLVLFWEVPNVALYNENGVIVLPLLLAFVVVVAAG